MQVNNPARKQSGLEITPATTIGMRSAQQEPASPMLKSRLSEGPTHIKPFVDTQNHPIEQHWLFKQVLRDLKRTKKLETHLTSSKNLKTVRIDKALSNHLKHEEEKASFNRRYSAKQDARPSRKKSHQALSETKLEKDRLLLRSLMNNPEERSKIYENSLLQEYYLKDLEKKEKSNVAYLKRDLAINRHRKLTNTPRQNEALYMKHDEAEVDHVRMLNYVRHEKQIQEATKRAKRNITYRKELNLERINYIIECMVVRPLAESPTQDKACPFQKEVTGKLFFRYSNDEGSEGTLYTFVKRDRLDVLFERLQLSALPLGYHRQLFSKLTKFKTDKVLYYLDFVELLKKIAVEVSSEGLGKKDALALQEFLEKHIKVRPSMYLSYAEQLYRFFEKDIAAFLIKSKLKLCIEAIFRSASDRLEYGKFISLHVIFEVLSSYCLLDSIQRERLVYMFRYLALSEEGLNMQQFSLMLCLTALSDEFQLFKSKAEQMKKVVHSLMAKANGSEQVLDCFKHYFFERLRIFTKVLGDQ